MEVVLENQDATVEESRHKKVRISIRLVHLMLNTFGGCWLFAYDAGVNECKANGSKVAQVVKVCKLGCN